MPVDNVSRRRAIAILAATTAAFTAGVPARSRAQDMLEWRGVAMGADARILFCGIEPETARAVMQEIAAEIERLEDALSLFRDGSEICRLNREQILESPTGDMRRALALAIAMAEASGGLFDPTVQALWEAHADWFAAAPDASLPPDSLIAAARACVDWRQISLAAGAIRLGHGQRITLNGLGQGYVTDRVADLLRGRGFAHVLVDLGEYRALGPRRDGTPWTIAREGADSIALHQGALATSEGAGCVFGAAGAAHHLFDPRTGRSAQRWRRISVHHRSAAIADALSTALYAASAEEIGTILTRIAGAEVWATGQGGNEQRWVSR